MIPLRILLGFILMSLLLVTLYRFVPPPVTMTTGPRASARPAHG